MTIKKSTGRPSSRKRIAASVALSLTISAAACQKANDRLLQVTDPDIINPTDVVSPEAAVALANGALSTFKLTTGGGESTWMFGGLLADEWSTSSTFIQNDETDQRVVKLDNSSVDGQLRNLYRTRTRANESIVALQKGRPDLRSLIAEMYLARGYAELQLALDFCNGIPITNTYSANPIDATPQPTAAVFAYAAASLDSAMSFASGTDAQSVIINRAARITRARVALALNDFTTPAALVAAIPTTFAYQHTFSTATSTNTLWGQGLSSRRYSVGDSVEGNTRNIFVANALPFASAKDPRLPVTIPTSGSINGQDGLTYTRTTTMWGQVTSVDVANGVDARLIEAEVALKAGNTTSWLSILNALRAAPPKLGDVQPAVMAPLTDPGTADSRLLLQFREKAFWTFSRGQRLGDMRRLIKFYGRTEANTFPQGVHYKGGSYGKDVNLPVVVSEQGNPNFKGCTDRAP